jgi:heat shock protein beta
LYETAVLRSGYLLQDTSSFADRINTLMRDFLESAPLPEPTEEEAVAAKTEDDEDKKDEAQASAHDEL